MTFNQDLLHVSLEHLGYYGSIEWNVKDNRFYGKVRATRHLISYEGHDIVELKRAFIKAVDDYIESGNDAAGDK